MRLPVLSMLVCAASAAAQSPDFAPPVRLMAGDKFLGGGRMYPSPVWHDLNGDGVLDVVVGDLPGRLTVAYGARGAATTYGPDEKVLGADGKQVDLHNW
ncbi:MAG: hypothetical protein JNK15_24450 [Planctomycetes bacterium]|nr:hypothetical protein [Planctomycetota bacterium]